MSLALVPLARFARDGRSEMFDNLGDQGLEPLFPPSFVELWDLFLWQYLFLHLKFLHVAPAELEGVIFDSLRVVRCCSWEIFQALGWPGQIFPYLCEYQ